MKSADIRAMMNYLFKIKGGVVAPQRVPDLNVSGNAFWIAVICETDRDNGPFAAICLWIIE